MAKAGYNLNAAVGLQETFVRLSKTSHSNPLERLFASHPPSQERVNANRKTAKTLGNKGTLGNKQYQAKIAHLKRTKAAYTELELGRKALNNKKFDLSLKHAESAIKIELKEALFFGLKGDALAGKQQYRLAEQTFSEALKKNDRYFLFYLRRGLVREKLGRDKNAESDLMESIKLLATAPGYNSLGNIALRGGR